MGRNSVRFCISVACIMVIAGFAYAFDKCPLCGMNIEGNENTVYEIIFKEGISATYCCAHCGLWVHASEKDNVEEAMARDFISGELMDSSEMYFVFKSEAVPACAPSWIAFGKESEAGKFTKGFGGKVYSFRKALKQRMKQPNAQTIKPDSHIIKPNAQIITKKFHRIMKYVLRYLAANKYEQRQHDRLTAYLHEISSSSAYLSAIDRKYLRQAIAKMKRIDINNRSRVSSK